MEFDGTLKRQVAGGDLLHDFDQCRDAAGVVVRTWSRRRMIGLVDAI